jgi:hypothetical protein
MSIIYRHTQPYFYTSSISPLLGRAARFRVVFSHPPFFHRLTFVVDHHLYRILSCHEDTTADRHIKSLFYYVEF